MKKGITCEPKFDAFGNWMLVVRKARGKLTLEDIQEAATEYEQDYYGLVLKCIDDDMSQYWDDDLLGESAELYSISDMLQLMGRVKAIEANG